MPCLASLITPQDDMKLFKWRVVYGSQGVETIEYAPYVMRSIRTLKLVTANHINYRYKSTDRSELNRLTAQKGNCDDIVIVKNGFITVTSFTNLALFDGHQWQTPAHPLLAGTQRALLLEQGKIKEKKSEFPKSLNNTPSSFKKKQEISIPFTPYCSSIGLTSLPWQYFPWLIGILLSYCVLTQWLKTRYIHVFKRWL